MATLAELRARVQAKVTVDDTDVLTDWINEGVVDFMLQTGCRVTFDDVPLTAGTKDYELDTDILQIRRIVVEDSAGQEFRFRQTTPDEIVRMRRAGSASAGSPVYYYAVDGLNLLMVHPTPTAADSLTVYFVPRPVALSADGDTPSEIPAEFHKAVEYFALAEAADADDDASSQQGDRYRKQYDAEVKKAVARKLVKGGSRLPSATLGKRRWPRHREDVYP